MTTPAGWYPDPDDPGQQRWWDGTAWTEDRAPVSPGADDVVASPPPPQVPPPPPPPPWSGSSPSAGAPPSHLSGVAAAADPPVNGKAVASLVLSIVWLLGLGSILAIVLGVRARREIRDHGQRGNGMAVAGIAIGFLGVLGALLVAGLAAFVVTAGDDLIEGVDLTAVSQAQSVYHAEYGQYARTLDDLERGLQEAGSAIFDLDGIDVRIVRADRDSFCAESALSGEVRHIGPGGIVSQPGPC